MRSLKVLLSAGPIRPTSTFSTRPGAAEMRRWLLAGVAGLFFVLALIPLWDVWTTNVAGTLVNRAIVREAEPAESPQGTAQAQADLERAMALMEAAASRGPHTAAREIPILRTYGAAASLAPSDRAFELLLRSRNAGRLDPLG